MRTTKRDLEAIAETVSREVGAECKIHWAYGRPRLESHGGSVDVSPRLPSGQLRDWMWAYIQGIRDWHHNHNQVR